MKFPTLDSAKINGKTALVRVDINSPIDPETGAILDDTRIRECAPTIRELAKNGGKVVVLAHQGRAGDEDFTTLEKHAEKLGAAVGMKVEYVADVIGPAAQAAIKKMQPGQILLLENVRFYAEESLSGTPEEMAKTILVRKLAELADLYVNDAFGAVHRGQASLVGFGALLPTFAGRLMERELKGLSQAVTPERPCVYVLGGGKAKDSLKIVENVFKRGIADTVLTGGLVGQAFLVASGKNVGKANLQILIDKGFEKEIERAKTLLATYGDKIKIPIDVVANDSGKPKELLVRQLPTELPVSDIGSKTVEAYSKIIMNAKTVVANGPLGVFEKKGFEQGTFNVLKAMANSKAFTILGGGHIVAAAQAAGVTNRIKHVSTGGGACISFLSGEALPVVEMLTQKVKA